MDNVNKVDYDLIGLNELDEHINDIYNLIYKTELIKDIVSEYKYYSKSFLSNTQKYLNQLQIERFNILTKIRALFMNELYNKGFQEMNNDTLIYFKRAYNWIIKHYRFTDPFFEVAKQNCLYEIKNALIDKIAKYVNSKVLSYLHDMKNRTFTIKNDPEDKHAKIYTFKHIKVLIPTNLAKDYVKFIMEYHGTVNFKTYPLYYDLATFESESKILDNHCSNYANFEYNIPYDERIFNIINDEITRFNKTIEENDYDFTLAETEVILPRKG